MHQIYITYVYEPLYNGLILLTDILPFLDAGILIILFTIIVKLVLFPISKKAIKTQVLMKSVEPEIRKIKEKFKTDRNAQSLAIMSLYKEKGINPFSGMILLFIQLPIIFALYKIFYTTGFNNVDPSVLYSFVKVPEHVNTMFLGLIDVTSKSMFLAVLAAVSQYFQIKFAFADVKNTPKTDSKPNFQEDFAKMMQIQMKYFLPVMILFISYFASGALALYWFTSNVFTIFQEIYIKKGLKSK